MARVCDLTGKKPLVGNNVSHSNRHTKRRQLPNLQEKSMPSEILGRMVSLRLSTNAMRTIDKFGGIDAYMTKVKNRRVMEFSDEAVKLRKTIVRKAIEQGVMPEITKSERRTPKTESKA